LFVSTLAFSQIPTNYYSTATGTGFTLKTQLFYIINNTNNGLSPEYQHIDKGYPGLWDVYEFSDRDKYYENDNSILDMYSENPSSSGSNNDPYNYTFSTDQCGSNTPGSEGGCYNREHIVPQSFFDDTTTSYVKNDPHFITPTDNRVNGWRSNYPFGKVNGTVTVQCTNSTANNVATTPCKSLNGSKLGVNTNSGYSAGFTGIVFEPIDEFKGDIARMILYFGTRYESQLIAFYSNTKNTSAAKVMFDGTENNAFSPTFLSILKVWHAQDPVSQREIDRNNAIFNHQNNRNPFIDHPEYVSAIWGTLATDDIEYQKTNLVEIYPTLPKDNRIFVKQLADKKVSSVLIFNNLGQKVGEVKNTKNQEILEVQMPSAKGIYFVKVIGGGMEVNRQIIIK